MKNFIYVLLLFVSFTAYAQEPKTVFEKEGDLVKASYYDAEGNLEVQGFFKDKKLEGKWMRFDQNGNKTKIAFYKDGKKVGKWFVWSNESLKEINYEDNTIASITTWKSDSKVAVNNE